MVNRRLRPGVSDWHDADGWRILSDRFRVLACCDANPQWMDAFVACRGAHPKVSDYDAASNSSRPGRPCRR
jgi:hypothetical protein